MKKVILLFASIFINIVVIAQNITISGKILDTNAKPLIGASVVVKSSHLGAVSDTNGIFSLSIKKGDYTLICSYLGFKTIEKKITANENTSISFEMIETDIVSEEIVISAIKANENTPVAQTNISKNEIAQNNVAADIPFQLELTPSVVASSENGTGIGYTSMRIRGTDMSRINVSVNGIPLNDAESQGVFWVNMPDFSSSVDNIQIQRGVGTSTNGAAAFGASVNFQTKSINVKPYGELSTSLGSFNTFKRSASVGTGLLNNHFSLDMRYSKLDSDGWIKRGYSDHKSFYISGAYIDKKNLLKATVLLGEEHTGITWWGVPDLMMDTDRRYNPSGMYTDSTGNDAFYDGESDNYWQNHYLLQYSRQLTKNWNANLAIHATTGEGYYEEYKADEMYSSYNIQNVTIGDSTITSTDLITQKWLDNLFYGYTFSTNYKKDRIELNIGTSWNKYDGDHFGNVIWMKTNNGANLKYEWYNNKGVKTDLMAFAKLQYQLFEGFFAYADLQYRSINYKLDGPDDDLVVLDGKYKWDFFNPKAGVFYKLNKKSSLFASYAMANREPTRSDITASSKDSSSVAPRHETLHDIELGYHLSTKLISFSLNGFYMIYNDQLVNTGKLSDVGYPEMTNVTNSYRRGVEIAVALKPFKMLRWDGNIALSQNKIVDYKETKTYYDADWNYLESKELNYGTSNISYSPSTVASSIITFDIKRYFTASFISKYVGKQYIDNTSSSDRMLEAYFVNNISIGTSIPCKIIRSIDINILINNIFNSKYSSNAYGGSDFVEGTETSWVYYYPQAPTNIMVKAAIKF